jgi:hypothetical protein
MNLINFGTLNTLIEELGRLASLTGNVGKDVKRMLDRLFGQGVLHLCVSKNNTGIFGFALYLELLREFKANLSDAGLIGAGSLFSIDIQPGSVHGHVSLAFTVRELPSGMRDRQRALSDMASILNTFAPLERFYVCDLIEAFFNKLDEEGGIESPGTDRGAFIERFATIVRTGTASSEESIQLISLARELNSNVLVASAALAA